MRPDATKFLVALVVGAAYLACRQPTAQEGHGGDASDKASQCVSCHLPEYQSAGHHVGEKPTTCAVCHSSDAWHPTGLHHEWPLEGAHANAQCFDCHKGDPPVMKGTPKACDGCHHADFEKAPDHVGRFALTCEDCHTTAAWKPLLPSPKWPAPPPVTSASASAEASATPPPPKRPKPPPRPRPPPTATATTTATTTPTATATAPPDTTSHASPRR